MLSDKNRICWSPALAAWEKRSPRLAGVTFFLSLILSWLVMMGTKCESIQQNVKIGNAIKVLSQYHSSCFQFLQDFLPAVEMDVNEIQTSNQKHAYNII